MKKIYICIGVNGSGKTTYVEKHLNDGTLVINELDIQEVKKFLEDDTKSTLYVDSQNLKRRTRRGIYTCVQGKAEVESGSNLDTSISKLIALAESNPELKANENVNALIIELEGTENRIMVARQDYIKAVSEYNATIRKFPTSVFAKIFGFNEIQVFQASPESNKVPNVDLK